MTGKYVYTVKVLPDGDGRTQKFNIHSPRQIDARVPQIVGLLLGDGASPELLKAQLPTAQVYVDVSPEHVEGWVSDVFG